MQWKLLGSIKEWLWMWWIQFSIVVMHGTLCQKIESWITGSSLLEWTKYCPMLSVWDLLVTFHWSWIYFFNLHFILKFKVWLVDKSLMSNHELYFILLTVSYWFYVKLFSHQGINVLFCENINHELFLPFSDYTYCLWPSSPSNKWVSIGELVTV